MEYRKQDLLLAVAVVALVALAGCATALTGASPNTTSPPSALTTPAPDGGVIEDADLLLADGTPTFSVSYNASTYATVLLEGPSGDIIAEREVSRGSGVAELALDSPEAGDYTFVLRENGETAATQTHSYGGPNASIKSITPRWDGSELTSVTAELANTGDMPATVNSVTYTVAGETREFDQGTAYIKAGETQTLYLTPDYRGPITIEEPGTVEGVVELDAHTATDSTSFTHTFQGPQLAIQDATDTWTDRTLNEIDATITNTGDMTATFEAIVTHDGETIQSRGTRTLAPGESVDVSFGEYRLYRVEDAGTSEFTVKAIGELDVADTTISKTFDKADTSPF